MAFDVGAILLWVGLALIVFVAYNEIEKRRAPKLAHDTSGHRGQPIVVTRAGILRLLRTEPRGPNKYQNFYEGGYNAVYNFSDNFNEVVPINDYQIMAGNTAPAFIELAVLLEKAHGADQVPWMNMTRTKLNQLLDEMKHKNYSQEELDTIKHLANRLTDTPKAGRYMHDELQKAVDRASLYEGELASERAGTEGKRQRDLQPLIEVAGKQAGNKKSSRDDGPSG